MEEEVVIKASSENRIPIMHEDEVGTEKRKFERFAVEDIAFAVFRPEFKRLGRIKDISRGGLACVYLDDKRFCGGLPEVSVDILLSSGDFYMSMIPCHVIYDVNFMEEEYRNTVCGLDSKCCGLRFGELSKDQRTQLEFFLKNHTGVITAGA